MLGSYINLFAIGKPGNSKTISGRFVSVRLQDKVKAHMTRTMHILRPWEFEERRETGRSA